MTAFWYAAGGALFSATTVALLKVLVVPRRAWSLVASPLLAVLVLVFHSVARRIRRDRADRLLGFLGPMYVVTLLATFLSLYTAAFSLLLRARTGSGWATALTESGSSVFTLGFRSTDETGATFVDIAAAATGMVVIALFIAYLPTLYAAVKERERFVKLLEARLRGRPLSGGELLVAHYEAGTDDLLGKLYRDAEWWSVGISETHAKYPVLLHFRAPRAPLHWLEAMIAVAEAAAVHRLVLDDPPAEARAVVDAIDLCLHDLSRVARVPASGVAQPSAGTIAAVSAQLEALSVAGVSPRTDAARDQAEPPGPALAAAIGLSRR